jgi:predicted PurR-regulated permease PerM
MPDTSQATSPARGISYLYMAAAFVIVVAGMRAAEAILNPLLLAIFLSIITAPAYFQLLKRGVSNWLALLTVVSGLSIVVIAVVFIVMGSIAGFTSNAEHYRQRLTEEQRRIESSISAMVPESWKPKQRDRNSDQVPGSPPSIETIVPDDVSPQKTSFADADVTTPARGSENTPLTETQQSDTDSIAATKADATDGPPADSIPVAPAAPLGSSLGFPGPTIQVPQTEQGYLDQMKEQFSLATAISLATSIAGSIGQLLSNAFLILLIVIFILLEAGTFGKKLAAAVQRTEETQRRAEEIIGSVQHYIVIKTWVSLATGLLVTAWLWWWGVSHSPLWGLLAFLFNYIPNVGSIIAAVPAVLIAWLEVGALPAVAIAVGFAVINGAIGNFIEPRLMGKSLGLSALVIFFSMLFWGWVLGPIGMLLSVPLTMAARIAMDGFDDTRWLATLMGNSE